jgi:Ca-activated chloride channel family protein
MYNLVHPLWLLLILLVPVLILWDWFSDKRLTPKIFFSNLALVKSIQKRHSLLKYLPIILKSLLICAIAVALARPRMTWEEREYTTYGIDIILSIDVSGSMMAVDFRPMNRMEAAKNVALNFINNRENDRIGIVTFASYAHTLVPLTNDYSVLNTVVSKINVDTQQDGTAIGNGIAIPILRLKDSPAESKVIILLTDGVNNSGQIDPITAAEYARLFGIKVYAVGIGSRGPVDFPFRNPRTGRTEYRKVNIDLDVEGLNRIAQITGTGHARIASNTAQLQSIFEEIDMMEKTEIKSNVTYEHKELFIYFLYIAGAILLLMILSRSIFRISLP